MSPHNYCLQLTRSSVHLESPLFSQNPVNKNHSTAAAQPRKKKTPSTNHQNTSPSSDNPKVMHKYFLCRPQLASHQLDSSTDLEQVEKDLLDDGSIPSDFKLRFSTTGDGRRHDPAWYYAKLREARKAGNVRNVLDLFFKDMLNEDRILPKRMHFLEVFRALAHTGCSDAAFKTLIRMRQLKIHGNWLTHAFVFTACAEEAKDTRLSAKEKYQLSERALQLWSNLKSIHKARTDKQALSDTEEREFLPEMSRDEEKWNHERPVDLSTINALLNALAQCGRTQACFRVLDEMLLMFRYRPDSYTLTAMLQACTHDQQNGCLMAAVVWRHFQQIGRFRRAPNHYTLLLTCIYSCGIATNVHSQDLQDFLLRTEEFNYHAIMATAKKSRSSNDWKSPEERFSRGSESRRQAERLMEGVLSSSPSLPNSPHPLLHSQTTPKDVQALVVNAHTSSSSESEQQKGLTSSQKFHLLFGSLSNFVEMMETERIQVSNNIILVRLSQCLPYEDAQSRAVELLVMKLIHEKQFQPDIGLWNCLLKQRCKAGAKPDELLAMMPALNLTADAQTFSCLAASVHSLAACRNLLQSVTDSGLVPNVLLMNALFQSGEGNYHICSYLLTVMERFDIAPNHRTIQIIESSIAKKKKRLEDDTLKRPAPGLIAVFYEFVRTYNQWLKTQTLADSEPVKSPTIE